MEKRVLSKVEIGVAMSAAMSAPWSAAPSCGCGRAYVCVSGSAAEKRAIAAECKRLGLMWLAKAWGVAGPAIYMGYDNADGRAMGRAKAFAEVLKAHGLSAYADGASD
jgi:hypothetical protein